MIGRALVLYVLLVAGTLFWCRVEAAAVPLNVGAGVARSAASTTSYVTTAEAAWSGAAFNSGMTTSIGGRSVTVPATWRFAANAGQVALNAVRTTPAGAAASVAVSLLLAYGIQKCVSGAISWCVSGSPEQAPNGKPYPANIEHLGYDNIAGKTIIVGSLDELAEGLRAREQARYGAADPVTIVSIDERSGNLQFVRLAKKSNPAPAGFRVYGYWRLGCESGHTLSSGMCVPAGYVPPVDERTATDSDWAKVPPNVMTASDALLNALGRDGAFIDIKPEFATNPQVVPLSDPYIDPVTGKRFRDIATVQPNPDGKTAEVQTAKQEVDSQGNPAKDASGAEAAPQKQDDPCVGHETRLGCMTAGDIPEGPDLTKDERRITITPDNGWGPDTLACPADIVMPLHGGAGVVAYSFKAQCDFADGVRAPVIAMAWVAAVLIALGVGSKGGE